MTPKLMKPRQKLDNPFSDDFIDCDYDLDNTTKTQITSTPSGRRLERNLRIVELERQVKNLTQQMAQIISLVDPEDIHAAKRLKRISPSTTQLSVWAKQSDPPKDLADNEDDWM
ncbi:MAG: hypothetical protein IH892_06240 [Planctomycetes bacterium]|nr:hypothetical protein [Planctomycetota bacterium]